MCTEQQPAEDEEWMVKHLPLVRYVVTKLMSSRGGLFDLEDLVSFGVVGLLQAKRRYDPSRGDFAGYAIPRIRGAILDALRANDFVPRLIRSDARAVENADHEASAFTGEHLTLEETQEATSLSTRRIVQARRATHLRVVPIGHSGSPNDDDRALLEIVDGEPLPLEVAEHNDLLEEVAWLVERLPEREKIIISLHFVEGLTMHEIGAVLSISESRVCQLQARALHRLRVAIQAA